MSPIIIASQFGSVFDAGVIKQKYVNVPHGDDIRGKADPNIIKVVYAIIAD